jgi:hypothetical protein
LVTQQGANLEVIDLLTETSCLRLPLDQAAERASPQIASLAVSPNGALVACGFVRENSIALLSLAPRRRRHAGGATTKAEMEQDWQTLAEYDAEAAYASAWRLAARRDVAVEFLSERIEPATPAPLDERHVERLIRNLDHREFDVRQTATRELAMLGEAVLSHLKHAASHNRGKELNLRVAHIVETIQSRPRQVPGKTLRTVRAIDVLERIGTPAAQAVLEQVAAGESAARETLEAQRSLARLRTHEALSPNR